MYELIKKNLQAQVDISEQDFETFTKVLRPVKVKKKKDLLRYGEVCQFSAFVNRGCLRSYSVDDKGVEHVIQIALDGYWVADLYSVLTQKPSKLFIETLEDCDLLLLYQSDLEELYIRTPVLERYFRKMFSMAYVATLERLNRSLSDTAEVRYNNLIEKHPDLIQRVPLLHIASFLGITPESLSRIRRGQTTKHT